MYYIRRYFYAGRHDAVARLLEYAKIQKEAKKAIRKLSAKTYKLRRSNEG